jgi:hypothetical protein
MLGEGSTVDGDGQKCSARGSERDPPTLRVHVGPSLSPSPPSKAVLELSSLVPKVPRECPWVSEEVVLWGPHALNLIGISLSWAICFN